MFSALKRLTGKAEGGTNVPRPGHQSMSHSLQRRFAKGVQYNMKIIIKGDRNVGKTCLFHRLQGLKFVEEYIPTEEIQVASIQWSYKATDDIVKVEVWDVVDRGKKKKRFDGLKLENSQLEVPEEPALDAEFLDVYKGTNGVIIIMDITKSWTFDYVQRELPKVPPHIPVLVLANHCDMAHHRTVTSDHVTYFIESHERPPGSAQVRYAEASMRNGFGLKLLHKFFNLPFLQLQRETLLGQLETNEHEIHLTTQELDLYQESDDADYNKFLDNLMNKRRQAADMTSSAASAAVPSNSGTSAQTFGPTSQSSHQISSQSSQPGNKTDVSANVRRSTSMPGPIGAGNPIPGSNPTLIPKIVSIPVTSEQNKLSQSSGNAGSTSVNSSQSQNLLQHQQVTPSQSPESLSSNGRPDGLSAVSSKSSGFMSKIFGKPKDSQEEFQQQRRQSLASIATPEPITSVEEFVPDEGVLDRSFLEDTSTQERGTPQQLEADSDSDTETGNPLVAGFQDDLDPEDALANMTNNSINDEDATDALKKRESLSSLENEIISENTKTSGNEDLHLNSEVAEITADALDTWLSTDSKWRRSPEGGEDSNHSNSIVREDEEEEEENSASLASSSVHLELLEPKQMQQSSGSSSPVVPRDKKKNRHKEKSEEKSSKKHKKKSSKEKESNKSQIEEKEKKKKRKASRKICEDERERDELEEFLNGPGLGPLDTAYEAF
ncbi:rab-like protein 6 [Periplaneta americana]|uniref:rab-like protein 6 n=1 Tax=Periplaneta americana TaxID=6978 RepID=UPI0037E869A7